MSRQRGTWRGGEGEQKGKKERERKRYCETEVERHSERKGKCCSLGDRIRSDDVRMIWGWKVYSRKRELVGGTGENKIGYLHMQ